MPKRASKRVTDPISRYFEVYPFAHDLNIYAMTRVADGPSWTCNQEVSSRNTAALVCFTKYFTCHTTARGPQCPSRSVVTGTRHTAFEDRSLHILVTLHITAMFPGQLQIITYHKGFCQDTRHIQSSRATSLSVSHHSPRFHRQKSLSTYCIDVTSQPQRSQMPFSIFKGFIRTRKASVRGPTQQIPEGATVAISVPIQCVTVQSAL